MAQSRKDFYKILGVAESATADEIKKSYRRLAKKYHPDATGGDKAKETKFKELSEAYETLGDEKKRADYNLSRKSPFGGGGRPFSGPGADFPGGGFGGGFGGGRRVQVDLNDLFARRGGGGGGGAKSNDPQDSFGDIFRDLFSGFGGANPREAQQHTGMRDATLHADIDLAVAANGGDQQVQTPAGRFTIRIPPGIEEGQTIRVPGKGEPAQGGRPAGDLLIEIGIKPHPVLRRHGADLEADVPITIDQAVLGGKVEVPTLEGKASVNVAPGTSSGLKLRLKGKGLPHAGAGGAGPRGDLYAVIQISVPRDIPDKAKELIAEFAKLTRK